VFDHVPQLHPLERRVLVRDHLVFFLCPACCSWIGSRTNALLDLTTFHEHRNSLQCTPRAPALTSASSSVTWVPAASRRCPGVELHWTSDIESDYLWHLHKPGVVGQLPWTFPRCEESSGLWFVNSSKCLGQVASDEPCRECSRIPRLVDEKRSTYIEAPSKYLNDTYRPVSALLRRIQGWREEVNTKKLRVRCCQTRRSDADCCYRL
jgi:hypothetical protein